MVLRAGDGAQDSFLTFSPQIPPTFANIPREAILQFSP